MQMSNNNLFRKWMDYQFPPSPCYLKNIIHDMLPEYCSVELTGAAPAFVLGCERSVLSAQPVSSEAQPAPHPLSPLLYPVSPLSLTDPVPPALLWSEPPESVCGERWCVKEIKEDGQHYGWSWTVFRLVLEMCVKYYLPESFPLAAGRRPSSIILHWNVWNGGTLHRRYDIFLQNKRILFKAKKGTVTSKKVYSGFIQESESWLYYILQPKQHRAVALFCGGGGVVYPCQENVLCTVNCL